MLDFLMPHRRRTRYIAEYPFETAVLTKFSKKYPDLIDSQVELVVKALKQYFEMALCANNQSIIMPSKVVDDLWHEFILFTKEYHQFCFKGLGKYLHHVPNKEDDCVKKESDAFTRTWLLACKLEGIKHNQPERLPLIFEIDAQLEIPGGINYDLDDIAHKAAKNRSTANNQYAAGCSSCISTTHTESAAKQGSSSSSSDKSLVDSLFSSDSSCSSGCSSCGGD